MKNKILKKFIITISIAIFLVLIIFSKFNVNAETRNNNPMLKAIKINGEDIEPKFDMFTTEYVVIVDDNVEKVNIEAIPDDSNAMVKVIGDEKLKKGRNQFEIKVVAEDKISEQSYYIYITKGDRNISNANLKSLQIGEYELAPTFEKNTINYAIEYPEKLQKLEIIAETEDKNAKIEILGNEKLEKKYQSIEIRVTAEDNQTIKTYYIIAKKSGIDVENEQEIEEKSNKQLEENLIVEENLNEVRKGNGIIIIVILSIIIIIIILTVKERRK